MAHTATAQRTDTLQPTVHTDMPAEIIALQITTSPYTNPTGAELFHKHIISESTSGWPGRLKATIAAFPVTPLTH